MAPPPTSALASRYATLVHTRFMLQTALQQTAVRLGPLLRRSAGLCAEAAAIRAAAQRVRDACRPRP